MSGTCLQGKKKRQRDEKGKRRFETRADYTFITRRVQIKCTREWLGMGSTPCKRNIFDDHMCLEAGRNVYTNNLYWPPALSGSFMISNRVETMRAAKVKTIS